MQIGSFLDADLDIQIGICVDAGRKPKPAYPNLKKRKEKKKI